MTDEEQSFVDFLNSPAGVAFQDQTRATAVDEFMSLVRKYRDKSSHVGRDETERTLATNLLMSLHTQPLGILGLILVAVAKYADLMDETEREKELLHGDIVKLNKMLDGLW